MKTINMVLTPRDGLFCKDGRGWFTSSSGRGHALEWPYPSTVLGALRTLWGRASEGREGARFNPGDWQRRTADLKLHSALPLRRAWGEAWCRDHRVWPAPADAQLGEDGIVRSLEPGPSRVQTLGKDDDDARERLWTGSSLRAKPIPGPRWWAEQQFVGWLCGTREFQVSGGLQLQRRIQTHVAIAQDTGVASEGELYSHDLVETNERDGQWGIACRVRAEDGEHGEVAALGSDRRLAAVESGPDSLLDPPEALLEAFARGSKGLRLYLVTPAAFAGGWLPDGLRVVDGEYQGRLPGLDVELVLRAAFVNRPLPISGWDMVEGAAKPTTRAVAPGAVYAFERRDGQLFGAEHGRALWLGAIGGRRDEGFGRVVPGIWNPVNHKKS